MSGMAIAAAQEWIRSAGAQTYLDGFHAGLDCAVRLVELAQTLCAPGTEAMLIQAISNSLAEVRTNVMVEEVDDE